MFEPTSITVYGAHWCPDCRRSKQFLGEHRIPYNWVDIEKDKPAEQTVIQLNQGKRIIPTIVFQDGSILSEPTNAKLASKLGLKTTARRSHYDLIVVGGGPAGLTAALYSARESINTLVIERAAFGGQAGVTERLDNVPGFGEGITGTEFAHQLRIQVERFGAELLQAQDVNRLHSNHNNHFVTTADGSQYSACSLLIATGSRYQRLGVPGEVDFIGAGIHFCATCDGPFYNGKPVMVVGGGNSAAEESLYLAKIAESVTLVVRGDRLKASQILIEKLQSKSNITIRYQQEVTGFQGTGGKLRTVTLHNNLTNDTEHLHPAAVFVFIGLSPNTSFLEGAGIHTNPWGFIITGHDLVHQRTPPPGFESRDPSYLETSVPGIFAAGDVRAGSTKQVAAATGEGATAALLIRDYLKTI